MLALISRIRVEGLATLGRRHLRRGRKMEFLFSFFLIFLL